MTQSEPIYDQSILLCNDPQIHYTHNIAIPTNTTLTALQHLQILHPQLCNTFKYYTHIIATPTNTTPTSLQHPQILHPHQ